MSANCKNCGGTLVYDIESAKVKCIHCDSRFEPETLDTNTDADEYDSSIFSCPNCGAQITSPELLALDYCMYCGSFVTLKNHMQRIQRPDKIIPFAKTAEECKSIYRSRMRKKIYAPAEFRDAEFLEGFKGIYIPFWNYEYTYGPQIKATGKEENQKGDYLITQEYDIFCEMEGTVDNIIYDASSTFDDTLSARIAPYHSESMKEFHPAYMFGFLGDTADVNAQVYQSEANAVAEDNLWAAFKAMDEIKEGHPYTKNDKTFVQDFNMKNQSVLAMLPVWFLTWRKGKRVAYSVINGETGEMHAEIPIDIIRYLIISIITAIPIFALLNNSFIFNAGEMLLMSLVLATGMLILYTCQLDRIVRRVMHSDDKGFLERHSDMKKENEEISENLVSLLFQGILIFFKELKFYALVIIGVGAYFFLAEAVIILIILVLGIPIYSIYRIHKNVKILKDRTIWRDLAGSFFAVLFGGFMLILDPAPDEIYYFSALICMAAVGLTAVNMVRRYNELITRPVPHFFERQGGSK